MTLYNLIQFTGWCLIINISVLTLSAILLIALKDSVSGIHSKLFGIDPEKIRVVYFQYLGFFKILIIVFNLTPYIALKLIQ